MAPDPSRNPDDSMSDGREMRLAASSTLIVFLVILVGRLLGLARDLVVAPLFGAGADVDALVAARTLPELVLNALAFGIITALVPVLSKMAGRQGVLDTQSWNAVSVVVNWTVLILVGVTVLGTVFPKPVLSIVAPGLDLNRDVLAITLLRIMMPVTVFASCSSILGAFLHFRGRFGLPSSRAAIANISIITISVLGWKVLGVTAVAIGWLVGAAFQLAILVPFSGFFFRGHRWTLNPRTEGAGRAASVVVPICLSNLLLYGRTLVERFFGSFLQTGGLSHLNYSLRIASAPMLIFANAVSTVYLVALSRHLAQRNHVEASSTLREGVRLYLFGAAPFTVLFLAMPDAIVGLLLQRGAFLEGDTASTAALLQVYVLTLITGGLTVVFAQFFFASGETATPNIALVLGAAVQVCVTLALIDILGPSGVAWGTGVGTLVSAGYMLLQIGKRSGRKIIYLMLRDFGEFACSAAIMFVAYYSVTRFVWIGDGAATDVASVLLVVLISTAAYLLSSSALGGRELASVLRLMRRRNGKV